MPGGYMGKMLFVDLTTGRIEEERPPEDLYRKYIGGYGLGAKILFDRMKPGADPLGPGNMLGFVTGPLTGTPALSGSRYVVVCKSPLTNSWGDANSGGEFGPALKFAGYDAVFFSGASPRPVYLFINEGKAELRDAGSVWGKDSNETEDALREVHGKDVQVACIGQAGEKLALISCVMNNKGRAAGRSGVGAVMGSKRLKAVVAKGKLEVPLAHKTKAIDIRRENMRLEMQAPFFPLFRDFGTAGIAGPSALSGDSPVKNWGGVGVEDFPNAAAISDVNVVSQQRKKYNCWRCNIACGGEMKPSRSGGYTWDEYNHKPEYETLASFGTMNLVDNVMSIIKANDLCNRYGFDTISAGGTISFAIECFENGLINAADTGGIELRWGNAEAMVAMLDKMGKREGFGDVLADGVKVAAQKIGRGAERFAMHVGGEELPMHDPKLEPAQGTTYLLDATPARHTQGSEGLAGMLLGYMLDPKVYTGRGEAHQKGAALGHYWNATGICMFGAFMVPPNYTVDQTAAITGWDLTLDEALQVGERIANLRQAFNIREGINPLVDFQVPGRAIGSPPQTSGPLQGVTVDMQTMIREYLQAAGWDPETTKPSREKLISLGLEDVAAQLYPEPAMA